MVACRYRISLRVFNSITHELDVELNARREIPYLRAPMYYFLFVLSEMLLPMHQATKTADFPFNRLDQIT